MALQTPTAWTAGDDATSTKMQTLTDAITQLQGGSPTAGPLDFAYLARTSAQTLTAGVSTDVLLTTEVIDAANGHSTVSNTNRYVGQTPGWYQVNMSAQFATNATGTRQLSPYVNGGLLVGDPRVQVPAAGSGVTGLGTSVLVYMNGVSDYVSMVVLSTVAVDLSLAVMSLHWIHS